MKQSKTIAGTVKLAPLPPPQPSGVIPAFPISTTHPDWPDYFKRASTDANNSGFNVMAVSNAWAADGRRNNAMRDWCVAQFRARLTKARATWAAGGPDYFSDDSYLYAGDRMCDMATVVNWWPDQLTSQEIADFSMMADQCVFNIWNAAKATWGGKPNAWSGWANNEPWSNYYYRAHMRATLYWAIHSQSAKWLDKLLNPDPAIGCFALMRQKFAKIWTAIEGTGYGQSFYTLWQDIYLAREALGVDLTRDMKVAENIRYWVECTTPDFKYFAPIGDQSRVSTPSVFDYQRSIIAFGIVLCPLAPEAAYGRWWLNGAGRRAIRPENYVNCCYDTAGTATQPPARSYFAADSGHLFARSDDGSFLSMTAGPYLFTHDADDQGEVQIYSGGAWRMVTANIYSSSGINAPIGFHNCIQFKTSGGVVIRPQLGDPTPPVMVVSDDGNVLSSSVDLKKAYDNTPDILGYIRTMTWDRAGKKVTIADSFSTQNGVTGSWRATVKDQASAAQIRCTSGATALPLVDWKVESPGAFNVDCWRVEFVGTNQYTVEISL